MQPEPQPPDPTPAPRPRPSRPRPPEPTPEPYPEPYPPTPRPNDDDEREDEDDEDAPIDPGVKRRGFAGMDPERQREIASLGGKAAHVQGTAHEFDSDEAREAGRKSHVNRGKF